MIDFNTYPSTVDTRARNKYFAEFRKFAEPHAAARETGFALGLVVIDSLNTLEPMDAQFATDSVAERLVGGLHAGGQNLEIAESIASGVMEGANTAYGILCEADAAQRYGERYVPIKETS